MVRKLLIIAGCLAIALVAWSAWSAHQNKQRVDAVIAEYAKEQPAHR